MKRTQCRQHPLSEVNPLEAMLGDDWHGRIQKDLELKAQSQKDVELKAQSKENDAELKAQSNEQVVDQNAQSKVTPPWRSMTSEVPSQADVCEVPPWGQARRRAKRAREQDEPAEEQAPFTKEVEEPAEEQAPEPKQEVEEPTCPCRRCSPRLVAKADGKAVKTCKDGCGWPHRVAC